MLVKAQKGTKCPKENSPREYIDDETGADVPETAYYLRLISDGSLIRAGQSDQSDPSTPSAKSTKSTTSSAAKAAKEGGKQS